MTRQITETAAKYLIEFGRHLVKHGIGREWNPGTGSDSMEDTPGLIDEINPENSGLYLWANDLIRFTKAVVAILHNSGQPDMADILFLENTDENAT